MEGRGSRGDTLGQAAGKTNRNYLGTTGDVRSLTVLSWQHSNHLGGEKGREREREKNHHHHSSPTGSFHPSFKPSFPALTEAFLFISHGFSSSWSPSNTIHFLLLSPSFIPDSA